MLTFEEWSRAVNDEEMRLADIRSRMEYQMIRIVGCIPTDPTRCRFTSEEEDLIDRDVEIQNLRYLERLCRLRLDHLKSTGRLPPQN